MSRSEFWGVTRGLIRVALAWVPVVVAGLAILTFTDTPESFKNVVEGFAVLTGAGYFFQRAVFGYFLVNLSLDVTAQRETLDDREDLLAVKAVLEKGDRGTLALHDAVVRVTPRGARTIEHRLDVQRLSYSNQVVTGTRVGRHLLASTQTSRSVPFLNLTPGERMTASCLIAVPNRAPCVVEVVVLGERTGSGRVAQWRSSTHC